MYVVGGYGYVGSRVVAFAAGQGAETTVVSRAGGNRNEAPSLAWPAFLAEIEAGDLRHTSVVWLLDGGKHNEFARLSELLAVADEQVYIAAVSTCTVYGDRDGGLCDETTEVDLLNPNAELKATCEAALLAAPVVAGILRFGALYGVDDHGDRRDRVEKWVTEAAQHGTVTVPEPSHWRGWLHRDQGARALYRAATQRAAGIFNVATANYRFGDVAHFAADSFRANVQSDGKVDLMNYTISSEKARRIGILDETANEGLHDAIAAFAATMSLYPSTES